MTSTMPDSASSSKSKIMIETGMEHRGMERVLLVTAVCLTFVVIGFIISTDTLSQAVKPDEPNSFRKARNFYKSCMDEETIEAKDASPLIDLMEYLGGWPVLGTSPGGKWSSNGYKFETLWAKLTGELSEPYIISTFVNIDDKNSSRYILMIDQQISFGMPSREYYLDIKYAKVKEAYLKYMTTIATMLKGDPLTVKQDMADLLEFETKLANLTTPNDERRDSEALYNLMTLKELSANVPLIDWRYYFDTVISDKVKPITDSEPIVNRNPRFIREVSQLAVVDTPPRVVVNYFIWRLTMNFISKLGERFRYANQQYLKVLYGRSSEEPRFRFCAESINNKLMFVVGRMYIDKKFTADSKANTLEMTHYLKNAFIKMLKDNDWMDEETKIVAEQKIDFGDSDFFANEIEYGNWTARAHFEQLFQKVVEAEWLMGPAVVNAYYTRSHNEIVFPAGILQTPFYNHKSPWWGCGRKYDKNGNLVQWWSDESIENFIKQTECIIDQYNSYVMPENDMNLNGVQTQGENIADNGGLKEAYIAYRSFVDNGGKEEPLLPGLNFTQDQLFFINYGQVWCSLYRPAAVTIQILNGVHSLGRYRVIGSTHNNEDFSRVFSCPKPKPSKKKCRIW
ncbi:neprilysin-1-like [Anneissia japonica]|uniref:neprilysin-1-like n=1 Tax=Anneissia japonica TaxID=1529436 RepID=UPI001425B539|nr:neprilysin-1-like [Anneissia japonica]